MISISLSTICSSFSMDTPICVFDANTFVDHIHEIKAWVDGGHLRLVVPTSSMPPLPPNLLKLALIEFKASENVEQLYKKSVELKSTAQEASRPKPVGKPARKIHPAFDINPRIAKEYLARIQAGKDGEVYVKERPSYKEEEKWAAVQFQEPKEEYTPWKDIPVEEEKTEEVPDDRPLSWAELAKKKLSHANGNAEKARASKGEVAPTLLHIVSSYVKTVPAKPKLVSKASGSDMSPWKLQKNAPKISAKEVPGSLRPLMSCALWRLHESIHRNDANQLFLLSDQEQVRIVAKKLNVIIRSIKELREKIDKSIKKVDLNITGALEEDGLAKSKEEAKAHLQGGEELSEVLTANDYAKKPEETATDQLAPQEDYKGQNGSVDGNSDGQYHTAGLEKYRVSAEGPTSAREESEALRGPSDTNDVAAIDPKDLVQSILDASAIQARHAVEEQQKRDTANTTHLQPAADILEFPGHQTTKVVKGQATSPAEPVASVLEPSTSNAQESPEDSDEEVVVFVPNPKRVSTQRKAAASSSRPSTAHGQSPIRPAHDLPTPTTSDVQVVPKTNAQEPREANAIGHGHPRPLSSGPTVIDPDAFGRSFAVNPDSSPRGGSRNARSQHSPRTSMQYANPNAKSNAASAQNSPRTSPPRYTSGPSPRPKPRAPLQKNEDSPSAEVPIISHQAFTRAPLVAPNVRNTQQSQFGPIGPPKPGLNASPTASARDPEFVRGINVQRPRSANGPTPDDSTSLPHRHSPRLRANPLNGFGSSRRGGHQDQRSSRPSLFEPEIDRTTPQLNDNFEPKRSNMPEVQYTLKSGKPRESTRGKGKLWVG